jgi:Undecaprenyl-phosphate galactose phosphotransferase WbaP
VPLNEYETWYRLRYRRTSSALTSAFLIIADLAAVMVCFGTGFFLVNLFEDLLGIFIINFKSFVTYWPYLPVFIIVFWAQELYPGASLAPAEELRRFTIASFFVHGGIDLSRYIEDQDFDPITAAFVISFLVSPVILLLSRSVMRNFLSVTRIGGIPAVIYGGGDMGKAIVDRLLNNKNTGYIPVLILDDDPEKGTEYRGVPIIHDTGAGPEIVKRFNIKMAIVAMPEMHRKTFTRMMNYSVSAFRYNVMIPEFFRSTNIWMSVRDFGGILGFATSYRLNMVWNLWIKRLMDVGIVTISGMILLPILIAIALMIKLSSPGPVLYKHERLGKNGKRFYAYKFRSMVMDADKRLKTMLESNPEIRDEWEKSQKIKNDPRTTGIGKLLRRTSLDELPQFINILKGEMSLVGPRPIVHSEIKRYDEDFHRIFSVHPGLTGLWQVSGRSDTDYTDRIFFDTYYLQSWSVWLDLWIIYKTIGVVLKGKGAY